MIVAVGSDSSRVQARGWAAAVAAGAETPEQELARLRAENKALRAEQTKLNTEREILRKAAKYFAGETNW